LEPNSLKKGVTIKYKCEEKAEARTISCQKLKIDKNFKIEARKIIIKIQIES